VIEVVAKATRRRFSVDYKRKIVREADACKTPGAVGALLRREGLYSSHLTTWRAARERGELAGALKKRGPVRRVADPRDKSIRPPVNYTNSLKTKQLAASHTADKTPAHYEEDHLVSLELGGHPRDPRNLWPERWGTPGHPLTHLGPFPSHLVGANAKDKTENALHAEVCHGTLTLREARFIIATDWFKYYRDKVLK